MHTKHNNTTTGRTAPLGDESILCANSCTNIRTVSARCACLCACVCVYVQACVRERFSTWCMWWWWEARRVLSINIEVGTVVPFIDDPEVCKYAYILMVRIAIKFGVCVCLCFLFDFFFKDFYYTRFCGSMQI